MGNRIVRSSARGIEIGSFDSLKFFPDTVSTIKIDLGLESTAPDSLLLSFSDGSLYDPSVGAKRFGQKSPLAALEETPVAGGTNNPRITFFEEVIAAFFGNEDPITSYAREHLRVGDFDPALIELRNRFNLFGDIRSYHVLHMLETEIPAVFDMMETLDLGNFIRLIQDNISDSTPALIVELVNLAKREDRLGTNAKCAILSFSIDNARLEEYKKTVRASHQLFIFNMWHSALSILLEADGYYAKIVLERIAEDGFFKGSLRERKEANATLAYHERAIRTEELSGRAVIRDTFMDEIVRLLDIKGPQQFVLVDLRRSPSLEPDHSKEMRAGSGSLTFPEYDKDILTAGDVALENAGNGNVVLVFNCRPIYEATGQFFTVDDPSDDVEALLKYLGNYFGEISVEGRTVRLMVSHRE